MPKDEQGFTLESSVKTLSLKFYGEQVLEFYGTDAERAEVRTYAERLKDATYALKDAEEQDKKGQLDPNEVDIDQLRADREQALLDLDAKVTEIVTDRGYWEDFTRNLQSLDPDDVQVFMIVHDKDYNSDDFWLPSVEKPHIHLICRLTPKQGVKRAPLKLRTMLNKLHVRYREDLDKTVVENGVSTIRDFAAMLLYLTHETEQAKRDGKWMYSREEIITNVSDMVYDEILNGLSGRLSDVKLSEKELTTICADAYNAGYSLTDFNLFAKDVGMYSLFSSSKCKVVERFYKNGIDARMNEHRSLDRCIIYMQGRQGDGKTYNSREALQNLGIPPQNILDITNSGSGKFDGVKPSTEAIIMSDVYGKDLLNLLDQYECRLYKRNSGDGCWTGKYLIITTNEDIDTWLDHSAPDEFKPAIKSRLYNTSLMFNKRLQVSSEYCRGNLEKCTRICDMFEAFVNEFHKSISSYTHDNDEAKTCARLFRDRIASKAAEPASEFIPAPEHLGGELGFD